VAAGIYLGWVGRIVGALGIGLAPRPEAIAGLARVGVHLWVRPAALRGAFVAATAVAARIGTTELAAHEIAWQFWNLLALVLDALAIAGQALVGRALGGGDALEARAVAARVVHWGLWLGVVLGVATATVAPVLPRVFSGDGAVRALATFLLLWVAVMQPINGVVFAWDGILIGAGDQRYLALAMAGAAALFVPAAVAVAWLGLGIGWLWAALVGFMAARMVPLSARGRRGAWAVPGAVR
jgi:putative MATE family efflux protein